MKNLASLLLILFCSLWANAQNVEEYLTFGENADDQDTDFLGFCLLPGSNLLERFVEIHINSDGSLKYTFLTMDGFVNRAAGRERCAANIKSANFFNNFGIKNPGIVADLWKLRYREYPYYKEVRDSSDKVSLQGWSTNDNSNVMPSEAQMAILKRYGINKISDYCYGLMAFMLLHDMEDPVWIEKYKNASYGGSAPPTSNNGVHIEFDQIGNENNDATDDEETTVID